EIEPVETTGHDDIAQHEIEALVVAQFGKRHVDIVRAFDPKTQLTEIAGRNLRNLVVVFDQQGPLAGTRTKTVLLLAFIETAGLLVRARQVEGEGRALSRL